MNRRNFILRAARFVILAGVSGFAGRWNRRTCLSDAYAAGAEALQGRPYHHFADGFRNPPGSLEHRHDLSAWIRHIWREIRRDDPVAPADHFLGHDTAARLLMETGAGNKLTWLGHSAFLLRLAGRNILLDPSLSDYATSMPPFGPKRYTPPGLPVKHLPGIDLVIISHNHYDHLDRATLEALPNRHRIPVIVPLKLGGLIAEMGFRNVIELDWHDTHRDDPVTVTAVPAVHFSARSLFDRNSTLWAGYAISDGNTKVYFSGDTGYHPIFRDLGRRYGPFDLGIVPIGAYQRTSNMKNTHATPEEAVRLGLDMRVQTLVPMHWGSLVLSAEPPFEPPVRFLAAGRSAGFAAARLWKMAVGETRVLG